jgi:hypothetical protein
MVQVGRFAAVEWAEALGAALKEAEALGAPDTLDTYYTAVLAGISCKDRVLRRAAWEAAYRHTPHGLPVEL